MGEVWGHTVEDCYAADGKGCSDEQCSTWILDLAKYVIGVLPAFVAVNNAEDCGGIGVCASSTIAWPCFEAESIVEVVWIGHLSVTCKSCKARTDDEEEYDDFEDAEDIEQPNAPFREDRVNAHRKCNACNGDPPSSPAIRLFGT